MQTFPAALRIAQSVATLVGANNSLESINTAKLSDRALATVALNNSIYMLRKDSVAAESLPDVVAPKQGGQGRWFIYPTGGDSGSGLTGVWFVDAGALAGGTGSIDAPFNTFAAAITAAQADFTANTRNQTIVVTPADYSAEALQTLTLDATHELSVSSWVTPVQYAGTPVPPLLPRLSIPSGGLYADGVSWTGGVAPQVAVAGEASLVGTYAESLNANLLRASLSHVGSGTFTTTVDLDQSTIGNVTATLVRIRGSRITAPAVVTGDLEIDAYSNASQNVTASGSLTVVGRPARETVSVVVPAVLDGQVGYVDAIMIGELQGIPTGAPIIANPSADLVAAGAGGGYINCRCNSPGVVRLAFIGPLAGGAVDFNFSALQAS